MTFAIFVLFVVTASKGAADKTNGSPIRVWLEIGGGEIAYDTTGMVIQRDRNDSSGGVASARTT
jgi:hypothetical protein